MLYIGIFFLVIGLYSVSDEFYDVKKLLKEKILIKRDNIEIDEVAKVKIVNGLFCAIIGIYALINYFYY